MNNQEAIANIKGILDSDIGKLMMEDSKLSFGPAVEKAGRTFRPGMEEWLRTNAIPLGKDRLVVLLLGHLLAPYTAIE